MSKKVKIAHSLEELEDQVILTLVDRPILDQGHLRDEEDDVLQNDQIQMINEAKHNVELKSKLKNIADASSSHLEAKNEGISGILPHYDDHSYKPNTIEVKEGEFIQQKKVKKNRTLGSDYQENDTTTTKLNSQYGARRQFKKIGKTSAKDLLSFLDETAEDNITEVKKKQEDRDILKDSLDKLKKKRILDGSIKNIIQNQVVDDEEESYLFKAIERSRKKVEATKFNILQAIKEEEGEQPQEGNQKRVEIELNPISYKSSDNIRQERRVELKEAVGGTASVMFATLPSEKLAKKTTKEEPQKMKFQDFSKEELQKMRSEVQFLEDREVGLGLAGTLAYLRENSLLGKEEQVGRHTDKTISYNDPNDKIKLQYRNASGKLMKPKEAYRYICAKFHGEGPSKNKVEIRKKRELQELRVKQNLNEGGKLMKMLQQHQEKSNEAHLVLNLGSKGGNKQ